MKKTKIVPQFRSAQEEAKFWDTHSTEDFPEHWKESKDVKFVKNLTSSYKKVVSIRLDEGTKKELEKVAKKKGIGLSTAARMLLRESLFSM